MSVQGIRALELEAQVDVVLELLFADRKARYPPAPREIKQGIPGRVEQVTVSVIAARLAIAKSLHATRVALVDARKHQVTVLDHPDRVLAFDKGQIVLQLIPMRTVVRRILRLTQLAEGNPFLQTRPAVQAPVSSFEPVSQSALVRR